MVAVTVSPKTALPLHCHRCNLPTLAKARIVEWSRSEEFVEDTNQGLRIFIAIFSLFFLPFTIFLARKGGMRPAYSRINLRIPTCEACLAQGVQVIKSNPAKQTIKIAVHKDFASLLQANSAGREITS